MNVPINPKVMKQYRDTLNVPSSPSFIDTDVPITPIAVVNTPERPVLTSAIERGTLKISSSLVSVTGIAYYTCSFTVPNNKKYSLKGVHGFKSSGTFTISDVSIQIYDGTNGVQIYEVTSTRIKHEFPQIITLPAGYLCQVVFNVTAHVANGDVTALLLYLEVDEDQ